MGRKRDNEARRKLDRKIEKLDRRIRKARKKRARVAGSSGPADAGAAGTAAWVSPEQPPEWGPGPLAAPDVFGAMEARRSVKRFTDRRVARAEIERLLAAATLAPNHKMTEPWRFYVLGPQARRAYGDALGARKARKVEDPDAAEQVRAKVAGEHESLPAMVAVAMTSSDDAERAREDYAATWMAIQNLALGAVAMGLGTHIKTGAIMDDPAARAAAGVPDGERIVAVVNLGEPASLPTGKARRPASELTTWRD